MKVKKIYKSKLVGCHILTCEVCSEMYKRGYNSEGKYWDDLSADKLKPIKYRLVKTIKPLVKNK